MNDVAGLNVLNVVGSLRTQSEALRQLCGEHRICNVGAMYDVVDRDIEFSTSAPKEGTSEG